MRKGRPPLSPTSPSIGSAFFDFDKMRSDILKRQHEAMRPFQLELRELEIVESMLQRQADPGIDMHERLIAKAAAPKPRAKPNGQHLPYAGMTQRKAIVAVIAQEPGLEAYEVAERLISGGFPFLTAAPKASVHTALRDLIKMGSLQRKTIVGKRSMAKLHHYYPVDYRVAETPLRQSRRSQKSKEHIGIGTAVLAALKKAPSEGFDRGEVLALLDHGFTRTQVTWALNGLVQEGHVKRHLQASKKPSETRFTLV